MCLELYVIISLFLDKCEYPNFPKREPREIQQVYQNQKSRKLVKGYWALYISTYEWKNGWTSRQTTEFQKLKNKVRLRKKKLRIHYISSHYWGFSRATFCFHEVFLFGSPTLKNQGHYVLDHYFAQKKKSLGALYKQL